MRSWHPASHRAAPGLGAVMVGLAAALPFLPSLNSYFLADDFGLIAAFAGQPLSSALALFVSPWITIYGVVPDELRPLLALSYMVDARWGAGWPVGYHATNVGLHVLNAWLVLALGLHVARLALAPAVLAALLFAVLPIHAETVGWISGRADSLPGLFFLAAVLGFALWRQGRNRWAYAAAVVAAFLALWTKQSAILLAPTLLLYDALVARRLPWVSPRQSLLPHLPFIGLTLAYLGLRVALFGNAVREHQVTEAVLGKFLLGQGRYLGTLLSGEVPADQPPLVGVAALVALGLALGWTAWAGLRVSYLPVGSHHGLALFFGPAWWLMTVAPLAVTYDTPRHLYLAAVGPALLVGLAADWLWRGRGASARTAVALAGAALVAGYALALRSALVPWEAAAAVSAKMAADLGQVALEVPAGSLLVLGAEDRRRLPTGDTWLWSWASPFVLRPPFQATDVLGRVSVVEKEPTYCCGVDLWHRHVQVEVGGWAARAERPPVLVLAWESGSGSLFRLSDEEAPWLREQALQLVASPDPLELERLYSAIISRAFDWPNPPPLEAE